MKDLNRYIDHTILKPIATKEDILKIVKEANEYNFYSICIPQTYLELAKDKLISSVNLCTVVGFPLGYNLSKDEETKKSIELGSNEIDMVMNISEFKNKNYKFVEKEIFLLKKICNKNILKVIVETSYLDQDELKDITQIVINSGADFIKTSTGFADNGAQIKDIVLIKKTIDDLKSDLKIKASGGISTKNQALDFIDKGVERIGTSKGVLLVKP